MAADPGIPVLRSDLHFVSAGYQANGEEGYVIHDPVRHRFFWLHAAALRVLAHWRDGHQPAIGPAPLPLDVQEVSQFLSDARLLAAPMDGSKVLIEEKLKSQKSVGAMLLHNYLFFRVPLFDPTRLLDALLPMALVLMSRSVVLVLVALALVGVYFTQQQWDHYAAAMVNAFSLEGALMFGTTIAVLKCFHEVGHGLVARALGVRVPVAGVAFMLLAPMLYTEVSDAWRLKSRRGRFKIAAAGVAVELGIAAVALFLWAFLPDGPWRNVAFFVSSTAWIMSVMVNLSPFMRFDGYHMLGDVLGVQNIGPRSFALANWKLRQILFGLKEAVPERFPPWLHRMLIAFAWGTWIYRLALFLGIAYLVYTMFPKVIGLLLAVVEVWFFIALPVVRELRNWGSFGVAELFRTIRAKINLALLLFGVLLCALPLDRHVTLPAVVFPSVETKIFAPEPAQVEGTIPRIGEKVRAGEVVIRFRSPQIEFALAQVRIRQTLLELRMRRVAADATEREQMQVLEREQRALTDELAGLVARRDRLTIRAAFDGHVRDVFRGLEPGLWVNSRDALLHVARNGGIAAVGLAPEAAVARLGADASAVFVPEDGARAAITIHLRQIGAPGSAGHEFDYLSSSAGGPVAVGKDASGREKPLRAMLPVRFESDDHVPQLALRGTVTAEATAKSVMSMALERIVAVALRESGF